MTSTFTPDMTEFWLRLSCLEREVTNVLSLPLVFPEWNGRSMEDQAKFLRLTMPQAKLRLLFKIGMLCLQDISDENPVFDILCDELGPIYQSLNLKP